MVSDRMNVLVVVWEWGFLYKIKYISKFFVNVVKLINSINFFLMVRVILFVFELRIVVLIGFLFLGLLLIF